MKFTKNPEINIFVATNKKIFNIDSKFYTLVHAGSSLSTTNLRIQRDDDGDNISNLNPFFCELTVQYWAWKNVKSEYYGFVHYRRFFSFENDLDLPKYVSYDPTFSNLNDFTFNKLKNENIERIVKKYDVLLPVPNALSKNEKNSYLQYCNSAYHNSKDIDITRDIISKKAPKFLKYFDNSLKENRVYYCNMFIMKKDYFNDYCNFIFPILFELHNIKDYKLSSKGEMRTLGYVAERLLNTFICYLRDTNNSIKIGHLRRIYYLDTEEPIQALSLNSNAVIFCSSKMFLNILYVSLTSFLENTGKLTNYDLIIFHTGFTEEEKNGLRDYIFTYKNINLIFCNISDFLDSDLYMEKHLSRETYARLLIPKLCCSYSKVLYLDCDLIFNDNPLKLFSIDISGFLCAAVKDSVYSSWVCLRNNWAKEWNDYATKTLSLNSSFDYFNGGVILFNMPEILKCSITTDKLLNIAKKNKFKCFDQDVLNSVFKNKIRYLDRKWNVMVNYGSFSKNPNKLIQSNLPKSMFDEFSASIASPSIIHFAGAHKPWLNNLIAFSDIWWKYARLTPVYESLLFNYATNIFQFNKKRRKFIDMILPIGSKRRLIVKKILIKFGFRGRKR